MKTLLWTLTLLFLSSKAYAFPDMVRHRYANCTACHVSPSGGGLLNDYGRMISGEVLSTWSTEKEAMFLHGAPNPEKWPKAITLGGDIRMVQVHREDRALKQGYFIFMQSSLEGAANLGPFTLVGSYGEPGRDRKIHSKFTRFYLMAQVKEDIQFRVGRFLPAFGLNVPYHNSPTRGAIGFGYDSERDGVELHWNGEEWHSAFSATESRVKSKIADTERGASFQLEKFLFETYRVGASVWNGDSPKQKRWLFSLHGILGFTEHLYYLSEFTWQSQKSKNPSGQTGPREKGLYHFSRLGYEVVKGLHLLGLEEYSKTDFEKPSSIAYSFGTGATWYPRPHFELELTYSKRKNLALSKDFEDYAYLMFHYYL